MTPIEHRSGEPSELSEGLLAIEGHRPLQVGIAIGVVVAVAVALLVVQNGQSTGVQWLWLDFAAPLWLLLAVTLGAGIVVGEVAKLGWRRARSHAIDRQHTLATARRRLRRG